MDGRRASQDQPLYADAFARVSPAKCRIHAQDYSEAKEIKKMDLLFTTPWAPRQAMAESGLKIEGEFAERRLTSRRMNGLDTSKPPKKR